MKEVEKDKANLLRERLENIDRSIQHKKFGLTCLKRCFPVDRLVRSDVYNAYANRDALHRRVSAKKDEINSALQLSDSKRRPEDPLHGSKLDQYAGFSPFRAHRSCLY